MQAYARDCWQRATRACEAARVLVSLAPDDCASRAYYAAFHAVSALLAMRGMTFVKHAALRAAVHRELVHSGEWDTSVGEAYEVLWELRNVGDYGGGQHVSREEAEDALHAAETIIACVLRSCPELGAPH